MKRRVTFIHEPDDQFDPEQLDFQQDWLQVKSLKAARDERWTLSVSELPQEVRLALKQLHELHIRWSSSETYAAAAPFASSVPSGLHIFLTPHKERFSTLICPLLTKVFEGNLNCTLPEDVFTHMPITAERFASSASLQHYETLDAGKLSNPTLHSFYEYLIEKICPKANEAVCKNHIQTLKDAKSIDIDHDTISQTVSLGAFFQKREWDERIENWKPPGKVEIGVFANQKASSLQELSLGGYLATLGEDIKPKPALFSFPSRHHLAPSNFTTTFPHPTGLHPTLRLTFPHPPPPPSQSCALHTYLTLPSSLFADKYQLSQPNLLASHNLLALRSLSPPAPDLEAPVWAVPEWGSALLLELAPPAPPTTISKSHEKSDRQWHATIPLHFRYLPPSQNSHHPLTIPNPLVFWACPSSHTNGPELDTNPFDRTNLGYDGLLGSRTLFFHLRDVSALVGTGTHRVGGGGSGQGNVQVVDVPVLDVREARWVEGGTGAVVAVGCLWGCVVLVCCGEGAGKGRRRRKVE